MKLQTKYFTILELLIVIAIIIIIIAILLPALNSARDKATAIQCSANLKSLGTAFHNYISDNDDYMLMSHTGITLYPVALYDAAYLPRPKKLSSGGYSTKNILICPKAKPGLIEGWSATSTMPAINATAYGISVHAVGSYRRWNPVTRTFYYCNFKITQHSNTSSRIHAREWFHWNTGFQDGTDVVKREALYKGPSHFEGKNHLFLDGHVYLWRYAQTPFGTRPSPLSHEDFKLYYGFE